MKKILVATLESVLEAREQSFSIQDVIDHELPVDVLDKVSREIINGESRLEESEIKRQLVKLRMAQGSDHLKKHPEEEQLLNENAELPIEEPKGHGAMLNNNKGKKRRRIERLPARDPVGAGRKKDAA